MKIGEFFCVFKSERMKKLRKHNTIKKILIEIK